ncbi:DgyrCDS11683 [Dimorphilus gyrociliatus]|uniref:DgyrCDS11683 n=1 Tax=Dimorphilus gyrociliatus TaxID=2664684 RepID=A0A7I8W454_9ANNE|nr:DgyrCDS11683 [Dimorphilus gyrociliatus]
MDFSVRGTVKPYLSSTVEDFQEERNYLNEKIWPRLQYFCSARGTTFEAIDFQSKKHDRTVELCLYNIIKSSPFFISLIGERYGDIPANSKWLRNSINQAVKSGYAWLKDKPNLQSSLIELELTQAVFLGECENSLFYFRKAGHVELKNLSDDERMIYESSSENERQRAHNLKSKIINKGLKVKYYTTPEELGELIYDDLTKVIDSLYPLLSKPFDNLQKEDYLQKTFALNRQKLFIKTPQIEEITDKLNKFIKGYYTDKNLLLLCGERGCGKSSLIAYWLESLDEDNCLYLENGANVFYHFASCSYDSSNILRMLDRISTILQNHFIGTSDAVQIPRETRSLPEYEHSKQVFEASLNLGPCLVIIDGIDELRTSSNLDSSIVRTISWLPEAIPSFCKLILVTSTSDCTCGVLRSRLDTLEVNFPGILSKRHQRKILELYQPKINPNSLSKIFNNRMAASPLFLTVIGRELRKFYNKDNTDDLIEAFCEARTMRDLWAEILKRWIKEISWSPKPLTPTNLFQLDLEQDSTDKTSDWLSDLLSLLVVSRDGLEKRLIFRVLQSMNYVQHAQVTEFDYALFVWLTEDSILQSPVEMTYQYFHAFMKESMEHIIIDTKERDIVTKQAIFSMNNVTDLTTPGGSISSQRGNSAPPSGLRLELVQNLITNLKEDDLLNTESRYIRECSHQLRLCKKWKELTELLTNHKVCEIYVHQIEEYKNYLIQPIEKDRELAENGLVNCLINFEKDQPCNDRENLIYKTSFMIKICKCFIHFAFYKRAENYLLTIYNQLYERSSFGEHLVLSSRADVEYELAELYDQLNNKSSAIKWYNQLTSTTYDLLMGRSNFDLTLSQVNKFKNFQATAYLNIVDNSIGDATTASNQDKILNLLKKAEKIVENNEDLITKARYFSISGRFSLKLGQIEEAFKYLSESLAIRERCYGKSHPIVAESLERLAIVVSNPYLTQYNRFESMKLYERAIIIREKSLGKEHLSIADSLHQLALVVKKDHSKSANQKCSEYLKRAMDIRNTKLGPKHPSSRLLLRDLTEMENRKKKTTRTDQRTHIRMFSNLSWREVDLFKLDQRVLQSRLSMVDDSRPKSAGFKYLTLNDTLTPRSPRPKSAAPIIRDDKSITSGPATSIYRVLDEYKLSTGLRLRKKEEFIHKSAWFHVPGRYPTVRKPFPPKRIQIMNRLVSKGNDFR